MNTPEEILSSNWGYSSFRPLQKEIISSILNGKDTLALLPTGGGKSLCYQVPALILEGVTLVVSPLIALMQDQVKRLKHLGIRAECLHSGLRQTDVIRLLDNTVNGGYKLLYVSPERLQTSLFKDYLSELEISLLAVDEAHCISQWGHDFRPSYLNIADVKQNFPDIPILALTATATRDVQDDIILQLQLRKPEVIKQSFARNNIFFEVTYTENKNATTLNRITKDCNIIYCRSRKLTELTAEYLKYNKIKATAYHAGMKKEQREVAQAAWMENDVSSMVATTAFGMGIDKPDVRMVLHYDAPEHLEAYYQEAGRAGRDGKKAHALALYNVKDLSRLQDSIELKYPPEQFLRRIYQSVAEYLQIPIGCQPNDYFQFDVADFCKKFSFQLNNALHALKLLEQEGLWTLSESIFSPATVMFTANRHVLDNIAQVRSDLGYVTIGLLRMFNSIFFYPTQIRENAVAKQLKMNTEELVSALEQLHQLELLEYLKPAEGPQILFQHCRADSSHLYIDFKRINLLKQRDIKRTKAMINFLENESECRERMILEYFDEKVTGDCGHCDVCRTKKNTAPDIGEIRKLLLERFVNEDEISLNEFINNYTQNEKGDVLSHIRLMIDERIIEFSSDYKLKLYK